MTSGTLNYVLNRAYINLLRTADCSELRLKQLEQGVMERRNDILIPQCGKQLNALEFYSTLLVALFLCS